MGQPATNWFRRILAKFAASSQFGFDDSVVDSSWFRRACAALAPVPLFGLGYITADPDKMSFQLDLLNSGDGSAVVHSVPITGMPGAGASSQVARLFATPGKGPRADYFVLERRTVAVTKRPRAVIAAAAPYDLAVIGSLGGRENFVNRKTKAGLQIPAQAKHADNHESSLFMASLKSAVTYRFSNSNSASAPVSEVQMAAHAPRGLTRRMVFRGETEGEYQARQRRCLATAIYFEARGEPLRGQLAVAQVIMNRVRTPGFPDTICGVVYQGTSSPPRNACQFSFACDGQADFAKNKSLWAQADTLAKRVTSGKVWLEDIGHATYYHATYVKPDWRRDMNKIKKIGRHIFYLAPEKPIQEADASTTSPSPRLTLAQSG